MPLRSTLAAAALIAAGSAAQAQTAPLTEAADGVYHFFAMGYSSMAVVGETGVLIIDPAFSPRAEMFKEELAKVTDKPVTHVVLSHEHFDHIGGTEVFPDAEIIMQENGLDVLKLSPLMPSPEVTTTFDEALTIDLGGQTVELSQPAIADGVATAVARVLESNVVFSADLYVPRKLSPHEFKEDTNFVGSALVLNTLAGWDPAYAINGHSAGNSVEALKENAKFYTDLQAVVSARFEEAFASDDPAAPWNLLFSISEEVEMPEYSDWEGYEENFPAYVRRMALSVLHGG
ncbi:MBL fold metallo-hydrolase [Leisingera sp. ANG-M1]|uniref:MBL fold metallo-hydrolase n=1 Tax=Leisingera sp. ANG-M1 TaxID=1577895 RepID=UPI00068B902B|nr:MBL fold metallo-hydrolase [Leisingera sp. ANG-M1]